MIVSFSMIWEQKLNNLFVNLTECIWYDALSSGGCSTLVYMISGLDK